MYSVTFELYYMNYTLYQGYNNSCHLMIIIETHIYIYNTNLIFVMLTLYCIFSQH